MDKYIDLWINKIGQGNRKFALLISAVWLFTILIMNLFNKTAGYIGLPLSVFLIWLDNHYLYSLKNAKEKDK